MPNTELYFDSIDNSINIGDTAYSCTVSNQFPFSGMALNEPTAIGSIVDIDLDLMSITVDIPGSITVTSGMFIFFSRPIQVEESSLKGYYANVTFENASQTYAELFSIGSETAISSK